MRLGDALGVVVGELPQEARDRVQKRSRFHAVLKTHASAESALVMLVSGNWKSHSAVWRLG